VESDIDKMFSVQSAIFHRFLFMAIRQIFMEYGAQRFQCRRRVYM